MGRTKSGENSLYTHSFLVWNRLPHYYECLTNAASWAQCCEFDLYSQPYYTEIDFGVLCSGRTQRYAHRTSTQAAVIKCRIWNLPRASGYLFEYGLRAPGQRGRSIPAFRARHSTWKWKRTQAVKEVKYTLWGLHCGEDSLAPFFSVHLYFWVANERYCQTHRWNSFCCRRLASTQGLSYANGK